MVPTIEIECKVLSYQGVGPSTLLYVKDLETPHLFTAIWPGGFHEAIYNGFMFSLINWRPLEIADFEKYAKEFSEMDRSFRSFFYKLGDDLQKQTLIGGLKSEIGFIDEFNIVTNAKRTGVLLSRQFLEFEHIYIPVKEAIYLFAEPPYDYDQEIDRPRVGGEITLDYLYNHCSYKIALGCGQPAGVLEYAIKYYTRYALHNSIAQDGLRLSSIMATPGSIIIKIKVKNVLMLGSDLPDRIASKNSEEFTNPQIVVAATRDILDKKLKVNKYLSMRINEILRLRSGMIINHDTLAFYGRYEVIVAWHLYELFLRAGTPEVEITSKELAWICGVSEKRARFAIRKLMPGDQCILTKPIVFAIGSDRYPKYLLDPQGLNEFYNERSYPLDETGKALLASLRSKTKAQDGSSTRSYD